MSISYSYVDIENFKMLHVGEGRGAWHHWGLMDHEGVTIRLDYLGYPEEKSCYLPYCLLKKLYTAFDSMGTYVGILFPGELYEIFVSQRFTEEESEKAYDDRTGCFYLDVCEDEEGYIHLTTLLPELLDINVLEKIAKDPALDITLFDKVHDRVVLDRTVWKYKHARWSQDWIEYCNKLVAENTDLQRFEQKEL